tara:strand:+ start:1633 stop:1854 length:222 start_codon:yes stop_codon:yes gene_type:complete
VNKKIKINNKNYVQQIIKANNKNYNLQYKPTPILGGEFELDSYNGRNLIAEEYQDTVLEVQNIVKQLRNSFNR